MSTISRTFIVQRDGRIDLLLNHPYSDVLRGKRRARGGEHDHVPDVRTVSYTRRDPLTVSTGLLNFKADPNSLDVTRKSGGPLGILFAPSWGILNPALAARKVGRGAEHWPTYVEAYTAEMRRSWAQNRGAWLGLLAMPQITLRCYCRADADGDGVLRCHRVLLAEMLAKAGAMYVGEVS